MSSKGEVTYEIRADDSHLESDLDQANKKVEQSVENSAKSAVKTEKEKSKSIKSEQESVTKHHEKESRKQETKSKESAKTFKELAKNVGADVKASATNAKEHATKVIDKIKHPIKTVSTFTKEKSANIKESLVNAFTHAKEKAVSGLEKTAHAILHPVETAKEASANIREAFSKAFDAVGETASKALGTVTKGIGAGMAAAGSAVVAAGAMALKSAVSMDQAMNGFIASTGKGTEETERYQNVLENIYKNNYGEDFQDIADSMELVTKNLGDMDDASLQSLTESAITLRDTFEYDVSESTRAAKAMMDQFGISGDQAMNLIAAGAENGLDYSGELLDNISEYSVQFAKVGLDADDMFKIFQKGADTGAFNLDKVGDAIKEMSIRVIDGSETTQAGFSAIGLNADEMAKKFSQGGESAKEAFKQTVDALASVKDPLAQDAAGVALFGTMWEDLGPEVVTALADIEDGAYATGEELGKIKEVKYDDLGSMFEGLKRTVEMLILPLGEQLIPFLSELISEMLPVIEEELPGIVDIAGELITQLMSMAKDLLPALKDIVSSLLPPLLDLIKAILPVVITLIKELLPPITKIISSVLPVLISVINALLPIIEILIELLMPVIDLFMEMLEPILTLISEALVPLVNALTPIISVIKDLLIPVLQILLTQFSEVFSGIVSTIMERVKLITNIIGGIVDFVKNVFAGNWKAAWENVKDVLKNVAGMFVSILKFPINHMIDLLNGFIKGINKIKIPDWVPAVGGKGIKLPTIPRLRVGMDYVPSDDFPALLHKGEAVLTAQENALYRSLGGFNGIMNAISERGRQDAKSNTTRTLVVHTHVELDGKEVGYLITPYVDSNLAEDEELGRRGN